MKEALALIDQIIDDHKHIMLGMQNSENAANDVAALFELYKPVEGGTQETSADYRQNMGELQSSLDKVEELLLNHFSREEKLLTMAVEKGHKSAISSALSLLMDEHVEIKSRIQREKQDISEIVTGGLPDNEVKGKSCIIRAYLRHTMKLIEAHAQTEEELLRILVGIWLHLIIHSQQKDYISHMFIIVDPSPIMKSKMWSGT